MNTSEVSNTCSEFPQFVSVVGIVLEGLRNFVNLLLCILPELFAHFSSIKVAKYAM